MSLVIKENAEVTASDEKWYDLFDGGYIKPEDFLEELDADRVREAMELVEEFMELIESEVFLEIN